ncbi:hypothetical protein TNCV_1124701 [Trichonephila clavipes]|uniref:Uncharacterized protein n=1 Tax=Trichonephila clavipes TaxID=2585209 RepID=A0A8X6SCF1_TRICX|nr:hypothetical protein TNCV_1124701 [Trichonephila clavipes]
MVIHGSERCMFRQVLEHPSERLMIRLAPRWVSLPIQPNSNTSIFIDYAVDEVEIHQLGIHVTIHVHRTLSMSEMRKPHVPTLRAHVQSHLSLSVHSFLCNNESSRCSRTPLQVCTRHSGTPIMPYNKGS